MHDEKPDQFVDELLEASLKRYPCEGARAGLEMRILAGIRSRERAARRRRLGWALAVCAGILAAVVLVFHSARAPSRPPVNTASVYPQTTKPSAGPDSADSRFGSPRLVRGPMEKPRTPKPGNHAARPTRPEQFPTPMPLTEQEKLLLAYFNEASKSDLVVDATEANEAPVTDLKISPIEISPLEIEPLDNSQPGKGK